MEQRLFRGCSGAVALRAVCPAQTTAGAAQNAVGPQVAEKPVVWLGRDLRHTAQQSRVAAHRVRVLSSARRLEVLDQNKDTVDLSFRGWSFLGSRGPVKGPFHREPRGFREWVVFTRCASSAWLGGIVVA